MLPLGRLTDVGFRAQFIPVLTGLAKTCRHVKELILKPNYCRKRILNEHFNHIAGLASAGVSLVVRNDFCRRRADSVVRVDGEAVAIPSRLLDLHYDADDAQHEAGRI